MSWTTRKRRNLINGRATSRSAGFFGNFGLKNLLAIFFVVLLVTWVGSARADDATYDKLINDTIHVGLDKHFDDSQKLIMQGYLKEQITKSVGERPCNVSVSNTVVADYLKTHPIAHDYQREAFDYFKKVKYPAELLELTKEYMTSNIAQEMMARSAREQSAFKITPVEQKYMNDIRAKRSEIDQKYPSFKDKNPIVDLANIAMPFSTKETEKFIKAISISDIKNKYFNADNTCKTKQPVTSN